MQEVEKNVESLEDLHKYVHQTLCAAENLLPEQFTTSQKRLLTRDRLCGIEFSLMGLRAIRLGAIWAADQNVLYFYNARGERYLKVKLSQRFDAQKLAG